MPPPERSQSLVVIFLRGGADGLSMVSPHFDADYLRLRPTLGIDESATIDLDGRFGLHPALAPLQALYRSKQLAIVHAVGSDDQTRSHFEAQDLMEHGGHALLGASGGWIARHLRQGGADRDSPLAAIAFDTEIPESLRGAPAVALANLDELALAENNPRREAMLGALQSLYAAAEAPLAAAGQSTLEMIARVSGIERRRGDAGVAIYPEGAFGRALSAIARLLAADLGVRVATVDLDGWDTHFFQGGTSGLIAGQMATLAQGLAAFAADLGALLDRTTIVVQTEFGRRAYENSSLGTDHGRASVMFALGAGIDGGRVIADWPGLSAGDLEAPGDLRVTADYRDVLAEILVSALGNSQGAAVFPGFTPTFRGVCKLG